VNADFDLLTFIKEVLFFVVIINPASKMVVIPVLAKEVGENETRSLAIRATLVAAIILVLFAFAGSFILEDVFHIDVFSLMVVGGAVLIFMGFRALERGIFYDIDVHHRLADFVIVPLASPMIAGAGTMALVIFESSMNGPLYASAAVVGAIGLNLVFMLVSLRLGEWLDKHNVMGALIRIMGLFVAAIGVHMLIQGIIGSIELAGASDLLNGL